MSQPQQLQSLCHSVYNGVRLSAQGPTFFVFELPSASGSEYLDGIAAIARARHKMRWNDTRGRTQRLPISGPMMFAGLLSCYRSTELELRESNGSCEHDSALSSAAVNSTIDFVSRTLATDEDQSLMATGGSAVILCVLRPRRQEALTRKAIELLCNDSGLTYHDSATQTVEFRGHPDWCLDCHKLVHSIEV